MNERIKKIRVTLGFSQDEFGKRLGVSRGVIVNAELGRAEIRQLFLEHICKVFNVSEIWLTTGCGEMFLETKESFLDNLSSEYKFSDLERRVFECYVNLTTESRRVIVSFVQDIVNSSSASEAVSTVEATNVPYPYEKDFDNLTKGEQMEILSAELDKRRKGQISQASTPTFSSGTGKMA